MFSAGVLLWSALTGKHLFEAESTGAAMNNTLRMDIEAPSRVGLRPPAVFDAICLRALERNVEARLGSALGFEESLRAAAMTNGLCGSRREVGEWVQAAVGEELAERPQRQPGFGQSASGLGAFSLRAAGIAALSDSRSRAGSIVNEVVPSSGPVSITSTSHSATRESAPVIESAPLSARELTTNVRHWNRWLLAGAGLVLVGGLVWAARRSGSAPSSALTLASSAATKPAIVGRATTQEAASAPLDEAKALDEAKPSAVHVAATARSAPDSAEPSSLEPPRRRTSQVSTRRTASTDVAAARRRDDCHGIGEQRRRAAH